MAININAGFHVGAATPIDDRSYLSKAEMLVINESIYPDYFLAVCKDDGGLYVYDKAATPSAETGKFVALHTDKVRPIQTTELPAASVDEVNNVYQYLGDDETTYTKGYWYLCKQNAETLDYEWVRLDTQPDGKVTLEIADTTTEGYLKTYVLKQFEEEIGVIDIPKDLVVTSGTVTEITYDADAATYSDGVDTYTDTDVADEESDYFGYPTTAGTFIKLVIANQKAPVFINTKDIVDEGVGNLTTEYTANVEVGGINVGDTFAVGTSFNDFVEKLIIKYYPPMVSLTSTPENKVVENGEAINVDLTAEVTRRSEDVTGVTFYKDNVVIEEVADVIATGGTYTHSTAGTISTDTTFKVVATDGQSTGEATVKYVFVDPYYIGTFASDAVITLDAMNKKIETQGAKTFTFTANNEIIVFAQPSAYPELTSIVDGNGFENIDSFNVDTASVLGYRLYSTKLPVTCTNFKYTFK